MLVFLAPWALLGLGLLSVPVILHIFKPRKVRVVPFSSLRWLRASQHRLSRRIKWHQILLFILRATLLTLLVLALARPVFSLRRGAARVERFVILDASRSMNYDVPGRARPIDAGKEVAEKLLLRGMADDRSAVLLAGGDGEALGPLASDPALYLARLRAAEAGGRENDLTGPLKLIPPMLTPLRPNTVVDLYFVTDNDAQSWSSSGIAKFRGEVAVPLRVHVINVGPDRPQNAWIAAAEFSQSEQPLRRAVHVQVGAIGDQAQERQLRLRTAGMPEQTRKIAVQAGRTVAADFEIPPTLELRNRVAQITLEPPDALASDDIYWLNFNAREALRILVIEPEITQIPELQPGFHLRTALEALSSEERGRLRLTRRTESAVKASEIQDADLVALADVPALADDLLAALEARVQNGGGLMVFLGPSVKREFYNTRFFNPLRPSGCLFPAEIGETVDIRAAGGDLARLTEIQWGHPLLAPLFDPTFSDLPQTRFQKYLLLKPVAGRADLRTVATIAQKTPAVLDAGLGAGRVVVFNTTANDVWSDLARRKSYVPLIDRLIQYLAGGLRRGTYELGDTVILPLGRNAENTTVVITRPDGQKIAPARRVLGGRTVVQTDAAQQAGVYQVEIRSPAGEERFPFVVQTGRRDSPLRPMDEVTLRRWWKPAEFETVGALTASGRVPVKEGRLPLDPGLMALALLVFLAEMLLVHWLCPKAPPKVVSSSLVSQRGFFAAGAEEPVAQSAAAERS
jgi:hypothetical protein